MVEKLQGMRCRKAVQTWHARARLTAVSRQRKAGVHMLLRAYYIRKCFHAMKGAFETRANGARRLNQLILLTTDRQKRFALK